MRAVLINRHISPLWKSDPDLYEARARARFDKYVEKSDGCWQWTGPARKSKWPYGYMRYRGQHVQAHRLSWMFSHASTPPADLLVCHHCDNPRCVRPDHLFLGTHADNMHDMLAKDRNGRRSGSLPGSKNPQAKLNEMQVVCILGRLQDGERLRTIATDYGVTDSAIRMIKSGRTWGHVAVTA